ncbi:Fpg/Nei family DNA glycosylase [Tessaracoccus terricola]
MPEGHVIHRLASALTDSFGGKPVEVTSPQGRFAVEAERLDGSVLTGAEAVGKHLFVSFDVPEPALVHIHLGLIGKLFVGPGEPSKGQVRLRITDGDTAAHLHGPQWCRSITRSERDDVFAASGPDPLRPDSDPEVGYQRLKRSGKSIAALLMDQKIAAGVGNIFRAEVLFRHRLNPNTPGREVDRRTWQVIYDDLVGLMHTAVGAGRIDTVVDELHGPDAQGRPPRVDRHGGEVYVYRRAGDPCLVCGKTVRTAMLEGRTMYWCGNCQRRRRAA